MNTFLKQTLNLLLCAAFACSASATAQDVGHLNVRTIVQKEEVFVNDAGETERRLVPADTVVPGESVVYTITFTNISDEAAENVIITNPISENLSYVDGSAFGAGMVIQFSVDGGQSFGEPDELTVASNGDQRPARAEDFTHVRWIMQNELNAGDQGMASFRARLN